MNAQSDFFKAKLENETDPSDLKESVSKGEAIVIIDARALEAY